MDLFFPQIYGRMMQSQNISALPSTAQNKTFKIENLQG